MKLRFFTPPVVLKASINKKGILTFYQSTIKALDINMGVTFDFGINEEDKKDTSIYFVIYKDSKGVFRPKRYMKYVNVKINDYLQLLGVALPKERPIDCNITKIDYQGQPVFKMTLDLKLTL